MLYYNYICFHKYILVSPGVKSALFSPHGLFSFDIQPDLSTPSHSNTGFHTILPVRHFFSMLVFSLLNGILSEFPAFPTISWDVPSLFF